MREIFAYRVYVITLGFLPDLSLVGTVFPLIKGDNKRKSRSTVRGFRVLVLELQKW